MSTLKEEFKETISEARNSVKAEIRNDIYAAGISAINSGRTSFRYSLRPWIDTNFLFKKSDYKKIMNELIRDEGLTVSSIDDFVKKRGGKIYFT